MDQLHSLGDTAGGSVPGGQVGFTFDTEAASDRYDLNQLRTEPWIPIQDETGDQDVMVNSVESCREVQ